MNKDYYVEYRRTNRDSLNAKQRQYHENNKDLINAKKRATRATLKKEKMNEQEKKIMLRENDALATYLVANATKKAEAMLTEDYETCAKLKKEKLLYISVYIQIMNLYGDVDDLAIVKGLDETYEFIYSELLENIDKL